MAKLKIAIVISTTRAARFGHKPAQWVHDIAAQRDDIETEIIDLRDFPMPFFDEVASNAWAPSQNPVAQHWQKKVAEFDGYIFVTAEYNHGIPAVLKNALDYAYPEWNKKAAGFVGYAVAALLVEQGHQVTGLTRSPESALPAGVQRLQGDLRTPETLPKTLAEVDGVCHLAGLTKVRESRNNPVAYWRTNVGGILTILGRLTDAHAGRIVIASTCVVYGAQAGQPIRQSS